MHRVVTSSLRYLLAQSFQKSNSNSDLLKLDCVVFLDINKRRIQN